MAVSLPESPAVTDEMIREAERKIAIVEAGAASEFWAIQRTRLTARADMLRGQQRALMQKLGKDVTLEALARLQGQIDENDDLLRAPERTLALFRTQLAQMVAAAREQAA